MKFSLVLRSVAATWAGVFVSAATGIFLTPYVLHRLGDEGYGLWVLVVTLTDYYLFLRVGIRSAIVRYLSRSFALRDAQTVNKVIASSFYFYTAMLFVVFGLSFLTAPFVSGIFSVKSANAHAFETLFLLVGIAQGFDFPLSVFEGALEASGRFDQIYGIRIAGMVLRVFLVIIVLHKGGGLFGVGAVTVLSALGLRLVAVPLAYREVEMFSLHPRGIDLKTFKEMLGYGLTSFSVGVGEKLNASLYPIIIGKFLSAAAVTLYSLPTKMLSIPLNGIGSMTEFVSPLASQLQARQDKSGLRRILVLSGQGAYIIFAPLTVIMLLFGKQMILLWVGSSYVWTYSLLVLLTFGLGVDATQYSMQSMLFGMGKHKGLVRFRFFQALGSAALGIALMRIWGLWGYALAVTTVSILINLIILPRMVCEVVEMPLHTYYLSACVKPCLLSLPLLVVLLIVDGGFPPASWKGLVTALLMGFVVYILTMAFAVWRGKNKQDSWPSPDILAVMASRAFPRKFRADGTGIPAGVSELG